LENSKQRSLIIFFLFLLLLINFLWINKEVKNIFSLDQSIYIAFIISTIALIIFSRILIAQLPSQISDNINKNVSTRILHAIKGKNDVIYSLRRNGIYEGEKILQSLREGEAIIDNIGKRNAKIVYIEPHELLEIK
jgi:hypothetical protein